jgi:thioredoxin 2
MRPDSDMEEGDVVTYACASCGAPNRIPRTRLREDPKCGRCHQKVFPRAPVAVGTQTWSREVDECPLPVLVDFWAEWCGPCRVVAPALEQIASERAGKLKIAKVNVDENQALAARFGVQSIPTLLLVRGPIHVDQMAGALPKQALDSWLDRYL